MGCSTDSKASNMTRGLLPRLAMTEPATIAASSKDKPKSSATPPPTGGKAFKGQHFGPVLQSVQNHHPQQTRAHTKQSGQGESPRGERPEN